MSRPVVFVTGAAQGIGRAVALTFGAADYDVVATDVDSDGAASTAAEVARGGSEALGLRCDVRRGADLEAAITATLRSFGRVDAAVNNAGGGQETGSSLVAELEQSQWDVVIDSNLKGCWLSMKAQLPAMLDSGGAIVNIASMFGLVGFGDTNPAYVAAKHGVVGLTKAAALQYAKLGIRINAVCPGAIDTPGVAALLAGQEEARRTMEAWHPLDRLGTPEEIAAACLWLCSSAATFVTGTTLVVDGGYTAR
jgi:NAD(P)-dependent dehydrogenase (short-subunit alcohol dehydrogenase family)